MIDLTNKTFKTIQDEMLALIPNTYDKRDTSPIQTAIGPAAYALEEFYLELDKVQRSAFIQTASGEDLDLLAVDAGVERIPASASVRLGLFNVAVPVGSRYSTVNGSNSINFVATSAYFRPLEASVNSATWEASSLGGSDGTFDFIYGSGWTYDGDPVSLLTYGITASGSFVSGDKITVTRASGVVSAGVEESTTVFSYQLMAETPGVIGNDYIGPILPISVVAGLTSAQIADILIPGDDVEDDESLRDRYIDAVMVKPFAGNDIAYKDHVLTKILGTGAVQVYPNGNTSEDNPTGAGTVVLSVLGADFLPAGDLLIDEIQTDIDPEVNQGIGLGFAPIGATVTVKSPTPVTINVSATISLAAGTTLSRVQPLIEEALEEYLLSIRKTWDTNISLTAVTYTADVYLARVTSAIVSIPGVMNASNVKLNGSSADVSLTETGALQQVPVLGTVTLNE